MRSKYSTRLILYMLIFNMALLTISITFPPQWYSHIMNEPDFAFLNMKLFVFTLICTGAFVIGYKLFRPIALKAFSSNSIFNVVSNKFLVLPLIIWSALTVSSLLMVLALYPDLLYALATSAAPQLRSEISMRLQGVMSGAPIVLSGVIWWAVFRMRITEVILHKKLFLTRVTIIFASLLVVIIFTIKMSRIELLPFLFGVVINYKYAEHLASTNTNNRQLRQMITLFTIGILLFIMMSLVRGYSWSGQAIQIFAYGPASFNRLAVFLSGQMHFYGAGSGIYVSNFQGQIPFIKDFIDVYKILGQPTLNSAWKNDFIDVANAGLNSHYTFPTVYGAIYSYFGWLSPLYFFIIGCAYRQIVASIDKARIFGIVFFPFALFSLFFWFGWNFILSYNFTALVITVSMLFIYEMIYRDLFLCNHG